MPEEQPQREKQDPGKHAPDRFFFFVDGKKYDWPTSALSGAELRAAIPDLNPTFQIFVEGHGAEPDKPVSDSDSFSLELPGHGALKFYTAPPATFGIGRQVLDPQ